MKILYFVLGDIKGRLLANGENSYNDLFQHDVIFFGPIPYPKFQHKGRIYNCIQIFKKINLKILVQSLPKNWYPDIVVIETPIINIVPDFYNIEKPIICHARDSWADMTFNRDISNFFDFIYYQTVDKINIKPKKSKLLPLIGNASSSENLNTNSIISYENRPIDILAIASINKGIYHKRTLLYQIIANRLGKKYNILFTKGIKKTIINSYYKRSKIVIDFSYVLSNRAYEAMINGCLFMSYQDNPLIREVFVPYKEYVPFSFKNVVSKIEYFLQNPARAKLIINNNKKKIQDLPKSPGEAMMKRIKKAMDIGANIKERIDYINGWPKTKYFHALATPLYFNYNYRQHNLPKNWKEIYFERIDKAIDNADTKALLLPPLIEASRMAFLINKNIAHKYLKRLVDEFPDYAWTYYLLARIKFKENNTDRAREFGLESIKKANSYPFLLKEYTLPFAEKENTCDQRRIGEYLYDGVARDNDKDYQIKACLNMNFQLLGDIENNNGNIEKAIYNYKKGIECLPIPSTVSRLAEILLKQNKYHTLLEYSNIGLRNSPYEKKLLLYKSIALLYTESRKVYKQFIKETANSLSCFGGDKRAKILRMIFNFLSFDKIHLISFHSLAYKKLLAKF